MPSTGPRGRVLCALSSISVFNSKSVLGELHLYVGRGVGGVREAVLNWTGTGYFKRDTKICFLLLEGFVKFWWYFGPFGESLEAGGPLGGPWGSWGGPGGVQGGFSAEKTLRTSNIIKVRKSQEKLGLWMQY